MVLQDNHAGITPSRLIFFDGAASTRPIPEVVYDFAVEGGVLYALAARWVPVPGTASGGYWEPDGVYATSDLCAWTAVAPGALATARSLAVTSDRLYVGTRDSEILL